MKQENLASEEENQYVKTETQMIEFNGRRHRTFTTSVFHMCRVLQERLRMSNTGM